VITNAINIGMELCNLPGIRTYLTGGAVMQAWSFSLTGNAAIEFLEYVHLDRVFVSVTRIGAARGATTLEAEEALFTAKWRIRPSKSSR
jgi:DeoR family transcriptional regulator of aga operon